MTGKISPLRMVGSFFLLVILGAALLPWQITMQRSAKAAGFHSTPLNLSLREQIGQSGFLAALSGFRSPLAAFLWIEAHSAWEKTEWGRMAGLFDMVTTLQPHTLLYWDIAAWHMAWNASVAALQDKKQQSEALRERSSRQYIDLGRDILERGIRNNPDKYFLYERLGILLRDKEQDHAGAADAFAKAASFPDVPVYLKRFAGYEAARVPGRERDAYDRLHALYQEGVKQRVPTLLARIRELEEKLQIPQDQRIALPKKPAITKSLTPHPPH
jgi:hypothetical protein